jgi:hypothetical protein
MHGNWGTTRGGEHWSLEETMVDILATVLGVVEG